MESDSAKMKTLSIHDVISKQQPPAPTKETVSLKAYTARRKMAQLRRAGCKLFQSAPLVCVIKKIEEEVEGGRLAIRLDKHVTADLGT